MLLPPLPGSPRGTPRRGRHRPLRVVPVLRKRAKAERVRLHDLRHFYASGLIAQGCDVVTVQRALGHSSATTTLNTYSHLWPTAEDRTRNAASALMGEALAAHADSVRTETS
jgi:integrase